MPSRLPCVLLRRDWNCSEAAPSDKYLSNSVTKSAAKNFYPIKFLRHLLVPVNTFSYFVSSVFNRQYFHRAHKKAESMETNAKKRSDWIDFFIKEWLLLVSISGLLLTSLYLRRIPTYSLQDFEILFILFVLFVTVKGLENSGLFARISLILESKNFIPLKLILATFVLSMTVTNDVALIVIVPLTLSLNINKKGTLIILEALAANAGSALTPFGNPQNLFIYWFYSVSPKDFVLTIAPFSLIFMILFAGFALFIDAGNGAAPHKKRGKISRSLYFYLGFLLLSILIILRILPIWAGALVLLAALFLDRRSLRIDYPLLFSFFCFFGLTDNLKLLVLAGLEHPEHVFLFSALASQLMSNVPSTLLFADFTDNWQALLWGVNVGGFGSLLGSFANLIAYKLYIAQKDLPFSQTKTFTIRFLLLGYGAFFTGIALYALIR